MSKKPLKVTDKYSPWAKRLTNLERKKNKGYKVKALFRIYCEGVNTEPEYFKSFPVNRETTHIFSEGYGRKKTALVNHVIKLLDKDNLRKGQTNYDAKRQIWIVFDYDYRGEKNEKQDFNRSLQIAKKEGLKVAYSNDSFELWIVLHFQKLITKTHRSDLYKFLDSHLNISYEDLGKTKESSKKLYDLIKHLQPKAIENAKRLHAEQINLSIDQQNPISTVFELVTELNKYLRK